MTGCDLQCLVSQQWRPHAPPGVMPKVDRLAAQHAAERRSGRLKPDVCHCPIDHSILCNLVRLPARHGLVGRSQLTEDKDGLGARRHGRPSRCDGVACGSTGWVPGISFPEQRHRWRLWQRFKQPHSERQWCWIPLAPSAAAPATRRPATAACRFGARSRTWAGGASTTARHGAARLASPRLPRSAGARCGGPSRPARAGLRRRA